MRHAEVVDRAVVGQFIVDAVERTGKAERVLVRAPAWYSDADWNAHYRLLERPGHLIRANGAAFATHRVGVPADVLICGCGWRGHYRRWPQHLRDAPVVLPQISSDGLPDNPPRSGVSTAAPSP